MKRIKFAVIIVITMLSVELYAGRYAGDFMMIGAGVKPLGMGGAFSAVADDGNAIYWNSSGIAQIRQSEIAFMHAFLYKGMASYNNVSFCQPLPNEVTIGLNLTRLTVDDIPKFDEKYLIGHNVDERINNSDYHLPGTPDGKFTSTDDMYQFAFSKHLHYDVNMGWLFFAVPLDAYIGANVKYIKRQISDKIGTGTGFDLSYMMKTDLSSVFDIEGLGELSFATNFQDIAGTEITWGESDNFHKDEILFNTKVGTAIKQPIPGLASSITLAYDVDYVYDVVHHFGIDWNYNSKGDIRLGFYNKNLTAGATVKVYGVNIDYAILSNPLGLSNRIGLRVDF